MSTQDAPPVEEHALPPGWSVEHQAHRKDPKYQLKDADGRFVSQCVARGEATFLAWKAFGITRTEYAAQLAAVERVRELEMELEHTENALGAAQLVGIKGMEIEDELRTERDIARARVAELEGRWRDAMETAHEERDRADRERVRADQAVENATKVVMSIRELHNADLVKLTTANELLAQREGDRTRLITHMRGCTTAYPACGCTLPFEDPS